MKRNIIIIILMFVIIVMTVCYFTPVLKTKIEIQLSSIFKVSKKEHFKLQLSEFEYVLRNRKANISSKENNGLNFNIKYNHIYYRELSSSEDILMFKSQSINGQKSNPHLANKYLILQTDSNNISYCKTNFITNLIGSVDLNDFCEELIFE